MSLSDVVGQNGRTPLTPRAVGMIVRAPGDVDHAIPGSEIFE